MPDEQDNPISEGSGGSLADAISQHLALKREHGADAAEVEHELEEALSPPRRDEPAAVEPEPAAPEPEPVREPEPAQEPEPEPAAVEPPAPEPEPTREPEPAPQAQVVEDGSEADPDSITEEAVASSVEEPKPGEITGSIEFDFVDENTQQAPAPEQPQDEHDLLEDTPDFFEETPEHDKLWFDEAPPRKFDF